MPRSDPGPVAPTRPHGRPMTILRALAAATAAALILAAPAGAATLTPTADSQVSAAHPKRNYGAATRLIVARRPAQRAFLRFDLGGVPSPGTQLILHLYGLRFSEHGLELRHASETPWDERAITFRTALRTGPRVVRTGAVERHDWTLVDVTRLVDDTGVVSLALSAAGREKVELASREAGAHAPVLEVDGAIARPSAAPTPAAGAAPPPPEGTGPGEPAPQPQQQPQPGPQPAPPSGGSGGPSPFPSSSNPCGVASAPPAWQHVVWIVMENKAASQVIGSSGAPYLNGLAGACGTATSFFAESHPSLPNYIAMTSGSTQGITDDAAPSSHPLAVPSIFSQLGGDWRALEESMPANCAKANAGSYAVRHNPAAYYTNLDCAPHDVPLAATPDVSARFTFITPNLCSDMHDCSVSQGDGWLSAWMPKILDSPEYRSGTTAVFVTFDEDDHSSNNHIATVVVSPSTPSGTVDVTRYDHYSLLRTTEEMLGLMPLGNAMNAPSMRAGMRL